MMQKLLKESIAAREQIINEETFVYHINLNERGSFSADVRNQSGETVYEIKAGSELADDESSIFDDGYMRNPDDLEGLKGYLVDLGIMQDQDELISADQEVDYMGESKDYQIADLANEDPRVSKKERIKITNAFHKSKILGGTQKVPSISTGLHEVGNALDACGFVLDMVTGDMINAPKGSILLTFRRKTDNSFVEGKEIENSRISFTWENLEKLDGGIETKKNYEIIAYLT